MKKTLIALIVGSFVFGFSSLAFGDDIWTLNFESAGGYSTSITEFTDGGYDFFIRTDGSNIGSDFVVTNIQGSWYFAAEDIDGEGATLPVTLTIDDINISGYTGLSFYVFLAEDDASDSAEDWDAADYVHIDYDIDNSGSFTNLIWVEAEDGTNTVPKIDTDFDGVGDGAEITSAFTEFNVNIGSTGSLIDFKVTFNLDSGDEDIALDVLRLTGTPSGGVADPTSFTATTSSVSQIDLSWAQNGNNDDVMVAWNSSDTFGTPIDGTSYSANDPITGGGTVLYNGSSTSYNHTSLNSNTQYFYKAWSVDGSVNYSSGVTANATTYKDEPSNHVTGFTATADGWNKIDLSWTENDGSVVPDGYLIKASTSDNVSDPVDGTPVADNTTIGDNSGAINLAHGTTSYQWTGLDAETTYYFKIYPYTNSSTAIDYKTDGTVPSANATTEAMPAIPNLMLSEVADPSDNYNCRFVELYNYSGSTIDFSTENWYLCRQANGNPGSWGDVQLIGSISSGSTYIVAYNQTEFEAAFGISADLYSSSISGNGDDGYFLYYGGDHSLGVLVDAYGVIDQDGSGEPWEYTDSHAVRNAGVTEPNSTWTASEWTIESATAAQCTPGVSTLPVTLVSFTATYTGEYANGCVKIAWQTASESDVIGFNVYRSSDEDYQHATRVNSELIPPEGSTSQGAEYCLYDIDADVLTSWNYWLEVVNNGAPADVYGPITYQSIDINDNGEQDIIQAKLEPCYPNPVQAGHPVTFRFTLGGLEGTNSKVELKVYNLLGELVDVVVNEERTVRGYTELWTPANLANGIYFYQLKTDGFNEVKKFVVVQ
jgi:hypothetical protein